MKGMRMDGYIIRKGEPIDWFKYNDGSVVQCEAGVDLWVTMDDAGNKHVQPLSPMPAMSSLLIGRMDRDKGDGLPVGEVHLNGMAVFDFAPLTYTPAPFPPVKAGERIKMHPDDAAKLAEVMGRALAGRE
jgi:hypothetical protein